MKEKEVILIAKTLKKNFSRINKEVQKLHSYKAPCILEVPIKQADSEYLKWIEKEIQ